MSTLATDIEIFINRAQQRIATEGDTMLANDLLGTCTDYEMSLIQELSAAVDLFQNSCCQPDENLSYKIIGYLTEKAKMSVLPIAIFDNNCFVDTVLLPSGGYIEGRQGPKGDAATITIGTTTTLPAGEDAEVTNTGNSSAAIFNFSIPRGADGTDGENGDNGWSPIYALVADGEREVLQLTGWTGGTGTPPAIVGVYVGPTGYVNVIGDAVDIRGPQGNDGTNGDNGFNGWTPVIAIIEDGDRCVMQVISWTGGDGTPPDSGLYVSETGLTTDISAAIDIRGERGAQGDPFTIDASGTLSERNGYDAQGTGFTYLATDTGDVYIKNSPIPGDWGPPISFVGDRGWSPIINTVIDGERIVHQVSDWVGGEGPKPPIGGYISTLGFTNNIEEATDIRGAQGEFRISVASDASDRYNWDNENTPFTFYALDTGQIAFKNSNASADWSDWFDWRGERGPEGPVGSTGSSGSNAFTTTTGGFTMPAVSATVNVSVADTAWMAVGQVVFIETAGYFEVNTIVSGLTVTLENLGYTGNAAPSTVISTGKKVSPAGLDTSAGSYLPLSGGTMTGDIAMTSPQLIKNSVDPGQYIRIAQSGFEIHANSDLDITSAQTLNLTGAAIQGSATDAVIFTADNGSTNTSLYTDPDIGAIYHTAGSVNSAIEAGTTRSYMFWENGSVSALLTTSIDGIGISTQPGTTYYGFLRDDNLTANRTYQLPDAAGTLALAADLTAYIPFTLTAPTNTWELDGKQLTITDQGNTKWNVTDGILYDGVNNESIDHTNRLLKADNEAVMINYQTSANGLRLGNIGSSNFVALKNTNVTTLRTLEFPNASGTFALTTDLASYVPLSYIGGVVLEADATNFVTGASAPYYKNKSYVGKVFIWSFSSGTTNWSSSGSGTTWSLSGVNLQASVGGGASDYTNYYKYDSYQFSFEGQQAELINFVCTVNATNAGEGIGVGIKNNDGISDLLVKMDLSNTGTRGQIRIYKIVSGTATLIATSASNLSFTTGVDSLSLKLNSRSDGFLDAKAVNNTTGLSVDIFATGNTGVGRRTSKFAIWHFGGTIVIPEIRLKNTSVKTKKYLLIGDSLTNGYGGVYKGLSNIVYLSAASGGTTTDIVNSLDSIINSGAENAVIMLGMNDAGTPVSTADYMINIRKIVNACRESGMGIYICYVTPTTSGTRNTAIQGYNTALLTEYNGIYPVIDVYSLLSNDGTTTGTLDAAWDSGDGIHLSGNGYNRLTSYIQKKSLNILTAPLLTINNSGYEISEVIARIGTNDSAGRWDIQNGGSPTSRRYFRGYAGTTETLRLDPGNTSSFSNKLAVGNNSFSTTSTSAFEINHLVTATSSVFGSYNLYSLTPSGTPGSNLVANYVQSGLNGAQNYSGFTHVASLILSQNNATSTGGNALVTLCAQELRTDNLNTGTVSQVRPLVIQTVGNSGGGTVTNIYGIFLSDQTVATTTTAGVRSTITAGTGKYGWYGTGTAQNYMEGSLGIGVSTPTVKLHVISTTEQTRLGYDASNYTSFTVSSNGSTILATVGSSPQLSLRTNGSDRLTIGATGGITIVDGNTIALGTGTGTKFGTATSQKIAFYNSTPIIQPANTVAINDVLVNLGLRASGGSSNFTSDVILSNAGNGLSIKEGTNATMGTATLVGGIVTVNTTKVTANSRVFIQRVSAGGTLGNFTYTISAATSITINSTDPLDTSTVNWWFIEPAP